MNTNGKKNLKVHLNLFQKNKKFEKRFPKII
jgi:hypothetical protein